jgi:hypothetical protein
MVELGKGLDLEEIAEGEPSRVSILPEPLSRPTSPFLSSSHDTRLHPFVY